MAGSKMSGAIDQMVENLKLQLTQIQRESQRRFEEEMEKNQIREAQMQELIVSTINNQLQTVKEQVTQAVNQEMDIRLTQFESRYEKFIRENNGKGVRVEEAETPVHLILTNTQSERRANLSTPTNPRTDELNRRDFRMQLPRADFPTFNGDNPLEWITKCRYYFEIHQVPERLKTKHALLYFQAKAYEWYKGYITENDPPTWNELTELVKRRFKKKDSDDGFDEMTRFERAVVQAREDRTDLKNLMKIESERSSDPNFHHDGLLTQEAIDFEMTRFYSAIIQSRDEQTYLRHQMNSEVESTSSFTQKNGSLVNPHKYTIMQYQNPSMSSEYPLTYTCYLPNHYPPPEIESSHDQNVSCNISMPKPIGTLHHTSIQISQFQHFENVLASNLEHDWDPHSNYPYLLPMPHMNTDSSHYTQALHLLFCQDQYAYPSSPFQLLNQQPPHLPQQFHPLNNQHIWTKITHNHTSNGNQNLHMYNSHGVSAALIHRVLVHTLTHPKSSMNLDMKQLPPYQYPLYQHLNRYHLNFQNHYDSHPHHLGHSLSIDAAPNPQQYTQPMYFSHDYSAYLNLANPHDQQSCSTPTIQLDYNKMLKGMRQSDYVKEFKSRFEEVREHIQNSNENGNKSHEYKEIGKELMEIKKRKEEACQNEEALMKEGEELMWKKEASMRKSLCGYGADYKEEDEQSIKEIGAAADEKQLRLMVKASPMMKSSQNEGELEYEINELFTSPKVKVDWSENEVLLKRMNEVYIGKNGNLKGKMVKAIHGAIVGTDQPANFMHQAFHALNALHMYSLEVKTVLKGGSLS